AVGEARDHLQPHPRVLRRLVQQHQRRAGAGMAQVDVAVADADEAALHVDTHGATLTSDLPRLRPAIIAMKAAGAAARPSLIDSRYCTLPSRTHGATSALNSSNRARWSNTTSPCRVARAPITGPRFGPGGRSA